MPDLSPVLQAVKEILHHAGRKGMSLQQIADAAVAQNKNMGLMAADFYKKAQTALSNNLKLKSAKPTFAPVTWDNGPRKGKPKQSWYRLREVRVTPALATVPCVQTDRAFLGKGLIHT